MSLYRVFCFFFYFCFFASVFHVKIDELGKREALLSIKQCLEEATIFFEDREKQEPKKRKTRRKEHTHRRLDLKSDDKNVMTVNRTQSHPTFRSVTIFVSNARSGGDGARVRRSTFATFEIRLLRKQNLNRDSFPSRKISPAAKEEARS